MRKETLVKTFGAAVLETPDLSQLVRPEHKKTDCRALIPVMQRAVATIPARKDLPVRIDIKFREPAVVTIDSDQAPIRSTIPFGCERHHINAKTFKALAGREKETLLRKNGQAWDIVADGELIDLANRTIVYRLGKVRIYS